jgi:oligopeptide/dipeptide ABC transporter ATP-binding protein
MSIADTIAEPLMIFEPRMDAGTRRTKIAAMLEQVGLDAAMGAHHPHELSGGQCQRVAVARAMILQPRLLVCDEPVSSLDVSIQGQIVNLLADMQARFGTAMLFISHNLGVVRHLSRRIMVMYLGRCVEVAPCEQLFAQPLHPYTRALLAALSGTGFAAAPDAALPAAAVPTPHAPASHVPTSHVRAQVQPPRAAGCVYRERCSFALGVCHTHDPPLLEIAPQRFAACHRAREFCDPAQVA